MASHVAEFETPQPQAPPHHAYAPHAMQMMQQHPMYQAHYAQAVPGPGHVKAEPVDSRFALNPPQGYALPSLPGLPPGPQLAGPRPPHPGGQQGVLSFPPDLRHQWPDRQLFLMDHLHQLPHSRNNNSSSRGYHRWMDRRPRLRQSHLRHHHQARCTPHTRLIRLSHNHPKLRVHRRSQMMKP